jgi:hypothetical protein
MFRWGILRTDAVEFGMKIDELLGYETSFDTGRYIWVEHEVIFPH